MSRIKTALIAYGLSGRVFHAPFIHCHPAFALTKVVERHKKDSLQHYPYVDVVRDEIDVTADPDIDLIVVCTPNIFHFNTVKNALLAGKHVVVEKPFTSTSDEADELIALAEKVNRRIFVYHNRRWDGDFLRIEKLISDKSLGEIHYFESHFDRYVPKVVSSKTWKNTHQPASGVLFDLGSHLIHQTITLFGLPLSLEASLDIKRADSNVVDYFELIMHYNDLKAVLKADMLVEDHQLRYVLKADKGNYHQYGIDPQEAVLDHGSMPDTKKWCPNDPENYGMLQLDNEESIKEQTAAGNYMAFYENVEQVLNEDKAILIPPSQARDVIRICELAIASHQQQKKIAFE